MIIIIVVRLDKKSFQKEDNSKLVRNDCMKYSKETNQIYFSKWNFLLETLNTTSLKSDFKLSYALL